MGFYVLLPCLEEMLEYSELTALDTVIYLLINDMFSPKKIIKTSILVMP